MKRQNLQLTIQQNESKPCSVSGCSSRRHRLYNVCLKHHASKANFGHPKASAILKRELREVRAEVSSLVERNDSTHVGLKNALGWFERWLTDAAEGKQGVPGCKHIQRLAAYSVSARELLITCGAVWLFSYRNAHRLPTEKALAFALAHQIMKLIPLEYATTSSGKKRARIMSKRDREDIGEYIRQSLGVLFVNVVKSLDKKEQRDKAFFNEMAKVFE